MIVLLMFGLWGLALSVVDVRERRLPNVLTLGGAALVLGAAAVAGLARPALAGGVILAAVYLAVHLMSPESLGAGDVKLALGTGAAAGAAGGAAWLAAAVLAPVGAAIACVVQAVRRRQPIVPHGPFMCGATLCALLFCGGPSP